MYTGDKPYPTGSVTNRQLSIYGNGFLTDIGKLALQNAHKAVPIIGNVFKYFYNRRKNKQIEAEKMKLRHHLHNISIDKSLSGEDRLKMMNLINEIKSNPHRMTDDQMNNIFKNIQNGVNLASMAGLYGINKYEQSKEPKEESESEQIFYDAETGDKSGGKMYLRPTKRIQQRKGEIPPKGKGFDDVVNIVMKYPITTKKFEKLKKKSGMNLTQSDLVYIESLFRKYNKTGPSSYAIKKDFFSLTKPSPTYFKENEATPGIYSQLSKPQYNTSINKVSGIPSVGDQLSNPINTITNLMSNMSPNTYELEHNLENIDDIDTGALRDEIIANLKLPKSYQGLQKFKDIIIKYGHNNKTKGIVRNLLEDITGSKSTADAYWSDPSRISGHAHSKLDLFDVMKHLPITKEEFDNIMPGIKQALSGERGDKIRDEITKLIEELPNKEGGKMYINPNKRRKQRQGKIPPKGLGITNDKFLGNKKNPNDKFIGNYYEKPVTLPTEVGVSTLEYKFPKSNGHFPGMFERNSAGKGIF